MGKTNKKSYQESGFHIKRRKRMSGWRSLSSILFEPN